jgi:phosphohistidine phosphatase
MKTVYIVRHAKSSWDFTHLSDLERPILDSGRIKTRKKIAQLLAMKQAPPQLILSSNALRAQQTAAEWATGLSLDLNDIAIKPALYHADNDLIFRLCADVENHIEALMLVGHNPALTNFVNLFLLPPIDELHTSAFVCLVFDTPYWSGIKQAGYKVCL